MRGRFPFQKLAKYPHMKPEDELVWSAFIKKKPDYLDTCDYDTKCGLGAQVDPTMPENMQFDHKILTQKKIDVVGFRGEEVCLIEVKPIANMRALGQILTYMELYGKDHPELKNVKPIIVCATMEREMEPLFQKYGILIEYV